jgi:hypothetical protein
LTYILNQGAACGFLKDSEAKLYRRRDIRTRPRIWWPAMSLGPWPAGQCSVCGVPCHEGTQYFFKFEEGRERHCRFCHDWTRKMLRA